MRAYLPRGPFAGSIFGARAMLILDYWLASGQGKKNNAPPDGGDSGGDGGMKRREPDELAAEVRARRRWRRGGRMISGIR